MSSYRKKLIVKVYLERFISWLFNGLVSLSN